MVWSRHALASFFSFPDYNRKERKDRPSHFKKKYFFVVSLGGGGFFFFFHLNKIVFISHSLLLHNFLNMKESINLLNVLCFTAVSSRTHIL